MSASSWIETGAGALLWPSLKVGAFTGASNEFLLNRSLFLVAERVLVDHPSNKNCLHVMRLNADSERVGTAGLIVGGAAGVVRSSPPALFAAASGLQCFALGTTYWGSRSLLLHLQASRQGSPGSRDHVTASTIAGGLTGGGIGLLARGPRNALPGALMFSIFGFAGQSIYEWLDDRHAVELSKESGSDKPNVLQRAAGSKWTPFSVLSDADYSNMLKEKMLRLEAEIAIIDDRISALSEEDALARRMSEAASTPNDNQSGE